MHAPVVLTAEQALQQAGYTTLAFNFRGVGGSAGEHGEGRAEVADVAGALTFLAEQLGGRLRTQAIAGYSFGSLVGGRVAAADPRVAWFLGIAPPLTHDDVAFLAETRCAVAFLAGRRDPYCDRARLESLAASVPSRPWLRVLDADSLLRRVARRARARVPECGGLGGDTMRSIGPPLSLCGYTRRLPPTTRHPLV